MIGRALAIAALAALPLPALAQASPRAPAPAPAHAGDVLARLQRVEDELAIRRILVLYGTYLDARDFAAYAALFAPEGEWIGGYGRFRGPAQIQAMLERSIGIATPGWVNKESYHLLSNPLIDIDGDRARVTSKYLVLRRTAADEPVPYRAGRYEDELVRTGGSWKIVRRTTHGIIPWRDGNAPAPPPAR